MMLVSSSEPPWRDPWQQSPEYRQLQILPFPLAFTTSHAWRGQANSQKVPQPRLPSWIRPSWKTQVREILFDLSSNSYVISFNYSTKQYFKELCKQLLNHVSYLPHNILALFTLNREYVIGLMIKHLLGYLNQISKSKKSPTWCVWITC